MCIILSYVLSSLIKPVLQDYSLNFTCNTLVWVLFQTSFYAKYFTNHNLAKVDSGIELFDFKFNSRLAVLNFLNEPLFYVGQPAIRKKTIGLKKPSRSV